MRHLGSPRHEGPVRLMEDQFIYASVRTAWKFHSESLKIGDEEGSALVGTKLVSRLAANYQREVSIVALSDNSSRGSVNKRAGAALTEGGNHAIAGRTAGENDVFYEGSNGAVRLATFPSRSVQNETASRSGSKQAAGRLGQFERIVMPMHERLGHSLFDAPIATRRSFGPRRHVERFFRLSRNAPWSPDGHLARTDRGAA
jgi:hypothetical protein